MLSGRPIEEDFERLGLSEYTSRFIHEGFDDWAAVADVTENDLASLDVRLGHRRILLRYIATLRGHKSLDPLEDPNSQGQDGMSNSIATRTPSSGGMRMSSDEMVSPSGDINLPRKRRYKRHPKSDENAPQRPPSAYVMYANQIREKQKDSNLNFTQLARLVGDKWKVIATEEKEAIENDAADLKRQYTVAVDQYKKSREYRLYQNYLLEFKERALRDEKPEKLEPPKKIQRFEQDSPINQSTSNEMRESPAGPGTSRSLLSISSILDNYSSLTPTRDDVVPHSATSATSSNGFGPYHMSSGHRQTDSFSRWLPYPVSNQRTEVQSLMKPLSPRLSDIRSFAQSRQDPDVVNTAVESHDQGIHRLRPLGHAPMEAFHAPFHERRI